MRETDEPSTELWGPDAPSVSTSRQLSHAVQRTSNRLLMFRCPGKCPMDAMNSGSYPCRLRFASGQDTAGLLTKHTQEAGQKPIHSGHRTIRGPLACLLRLLAELSNEWRWRWRGRQAGASVSPTPAASASDNCINASAGSARTGRGEVKSGTCPQDTARNLPLIVGLSAGVMQP